MVRSLDFVPSGAGSGPCQDLFVCVRVFLDNTLLYYSKWAPLNLTAGCNPEFDWHAVQGEGGRNIPPMNAPC